MSKFNFDYIAPNSFKEASELLLKKNKKTVIMAGGTDLLIKIQQQQLIPDLVISIKKIQNNESIEFKENLGLKIKANALLSEVSSNKEIIKHYPTIAMAAKSTANTQIRNMGTLVGNICNASPAADNIPSLLAMDSIVNIFTPNGKKKINLEDFFIGPNLTILNPGEIVTSILVPKPQKRYGSAYHHISQRSKMNCTAVGVATTLSILKNRIEKINIFISACGPTPIRANLSEKMLLKKKINKKIIHKASLEASKEANPINDIRASAQYRKKMIYIMTKRAINSAIKMIDN